MVQPLCPRCITYQIKICTKYRNKSKIDPLDYFCRLTKTNLAPEAFLIKDKEYSIISCSPETLIIKKGNSISTKPIAGTLKKNSKLNKNKALNYFRNNIKETKEHNMIVDMERNDLSRICLPGTVKITKEKIVVLPIGLRLSWRTIWCRLMMFLDGVGR